MGKIEELNKIGEEILNLKHSPLYEYRVENNYVPVPGEGSPNAEIMLVGEAPGANEAKTGRPFCGQAGKILDKFLESAGIGREEVFITSIVKDRPPKNRDPKPEEIEMYTPFLDRQIEVIRPKIIGALGRHAMRYLMMRYGLEDKLLTIGEIHGQVFETEINGLKTKIVPVYHPAAVIYSRKLMKDAEEDFKILGSLL